MQSPEASLASSSVSKSDFSCEYEYTRNYNVRSSCVGESFYKEHKGKRLCVLHHPDKEKSTTFDEALKRKLNAKDFNFRGVWFPDQSSFGDFVFNEDVDFSEATFDGDMSFSGATFNGNAYFSHSTFNGAVSFDHIKFIGCQDRILLANFSGAIFNKNACFSDTEFNARVQASFSGATFNA